MHRGVAAVLTQPLPPDPHQLRSVSVVVPFRNEAANLGGVVHDLKSQTYPPFSYEVVLVDDHSTDGSFELLERLTQGDSRFRLAKLAAGAVGKKAALAEAIRVSKGEIIITTDADCRLPETWCRAMIAHFENPAVMMCMGPVRVQRGTSFFESLQALEYVSVVAVTMGSIGWNRPTMATGANLAFRKDAFYAVDGYFNEQTLASGDDQFLMEKICARFRTPVAFTADSAALVVTRPAGDVRSFLRQRMRWAGKWSHLKGSTRLLAAFVFCFHLAAMASVPLAFFKPAFSLVIAALWILKIAFEGLALWPVARFTKVPWKPTAFFCWQVLYPVYAVVVALFSRRKNIRWKDRIWENQV